MDQTETVPQPEPSAPADESLSSHEATFSREARIDAAEAPEVERDEPETVTVPVERDKKGQFKPVRHRTEKDVAGPEDVPRIRELTRKLREAEAEVSRLRTPPASSEAVPSGTPHASTGKPTWQEFETKIGETGGYDSWGAAQDAYIDARDEWRQQQAVVKSQASSVEQAESATADARKAVLADYGSRVTEFAKIHPDYNARMDSASDLKMPPALVEAIITADNGPEVAYYLADPSHSDVLDEMVLLAVKLPVNEEAVALLQRRLTKAAAQTVVTGSVSGPKPYVAPRPPNPVRTGPIKSGDEPPGDDSSLAEHEKAFGRRRR